jgi:PcfJ-like protein
MDNAEFWQILIGFSPPGADIDFARRQLAIAYGNCSQSRTGIQDYFNRSKPPSYIRCAMNAANKNLTDCVFPKLSPVMRARIKEGTKPVDIFHGALSRAEAHEALTIGYVLAIPYLLRNVYKVLGGVGVRDVAVARWLDAVCKDPPRFELLRRQRQTDVRLHDDEPERITDSYQNRLDDLCAADLPNGPKTGVRAAFENSRARLEALAAAQMERLDREARATSHMEKLGRHEVRLIPEWYAPIEGVELLCTPDALVEEGRIMHHCVGSYVGSVLAGHCFIVSVKVMGNGGKSGAILHRSTAELQEQTDHVGNKYLIIFQHKAKHNAVPNPKCTNLLAEALRFWHNVIAEQAKEKMQSRVLVAVAESGNGVTAMSTDDLRSVAATILACAPRYSDDREIAVPQSEAP